MLIVAILLLNIDDKICKAVCYWHWVKRSTCKLILISPDNWLLQWASDILAWHKARLSMGFYISLVLVQQMVLMFSTGIDWEWETNTCTALLRQRSEVLWDSRFPNQWQPLMNIQSTNTIENLKSFHMSSLWIKVSEPSTWQYLLAHVHKLYGYSSLVLLRHLWYYKWVYSFKGF